MSKAAFSAETVINKETGEVLYQVGEPLTEEVIDKTRRCRLQIGSISSGRTRSANSST